MMMAGRMLMNGSGQMPESTSIRTRRPIARLVISGGVCQRDRLTRSIAPRPAFSSGQLRETLRCKRTFGEKMRQSRRSRPSSISTAERSSQRLRQSPGLE